MGDVDLHFDGQRMLFSMPAKDAWQVWEIKADGSGLRQLTPDIPKIDNYDGCYLPDGKTPLQLDDEHPRGALRRRRRQGRQPLPHGCRRHERADALLRAGPGLVSARAQRWPRHVHPLGVLRHAALSLAVVDEHEPRRHRAAFVVRRQLLLAELDLLRAPDSRGALESHRRHLRAPRRAAHGRVGPVRSFARPHRGQRRRAADSRLRQESRGDHRRRFGGRVLAEIPPPVSAQRELFPRLLPADPELAVGRLSRGCLRQPALPPRGRRLRAVGADPVPRDEPGRRWCRTASARK